MPSDGFDLTYPLRPEDYRAMMRDFWRLTPFRFWRVKVLQAAVLIFGIGAVSLWWRYGDPVDLAFGLALLSGPLIAPLLNRLYYNRVFLKQRLGEGAMRLTVDADGVAISGAAISARYAWSAVRRVTEPRGAVLLWITPYQAVIAPDRAFANGEERGRFVDYCRVRVVGNGF